MDPVSHAAAALWEANRTGIPYKPVRTTIGESNVETAYAVREQITERRIEQGARRKIGLTAASVQAQLGVSQPDYGMLFHDMHVANGDEIAPGKLIQPKVEAEIAFILGHDLMHEKLTTADVLTTIAWAVPALEIVDSRIEAWNIRIAGTVADNASLPWLARVMAKAARPLRSGDVVLERRTGPMVPAKPGTALEAWTQGLGSVRLAFGKD